MIGSYLGHKPILEPGSFVAHSATVVGQVRLSEQANIWYGAVLRGDVGKIHVGARTNIQDLSVVHITEGGHDTFIGDDVTVGHAAIIHACRIEERVLVGMGATILDGAVVEPYCIVGANSLVTPGKRIPSGSLALGSPARVVRPLTDTERDHMLESSRHYVDIAQGHLAAGHGEGGSRPI